MRGRRRVEAHSRTGRGRQAGHIKQILDRERHTGQRSHRFAGRPAGIDRPRLGQGFVLEDPGKDRQVFVHSANIVEDPPHSGLGGCPVLRHDSGRH